MNTRDAIIIPPNMDTTIPERAEKYFAAIPRAWQYMERIGLPRVDKLGRWPRTRNGRA